MRTLRTGSLALLAAAVIARFPLIFRYRFDSDEPQHMHVAWGWAHGLVQYRDVFDNHMPLFHLLSAPLFTGPADPRLLFAARMLMVPLFAAALTLVWFIARRVHDRDDVAWLATAVAAVFPPFFLGTLEYRTDDLWIVFWLGAVAVFVSAMPFPRRCIVAGLLTGGAFAVSMKSSLFIVALAGAASLTAVLTRDRGGLPSRRDTLRAIAGGVLSIAVVPSMIAASFAMAGLWKPFAYGVFEHNKLPFEHAWRVLWFPVLYPLWRTIALRLARAEGDRLLVRRRLFLFLTSAIFLTAYISLAPMTNLETYLALYPLAAVVVAPLLLDRRNVAVPAFALAAEAIAVLVTAQPWQNQAQSTIDTVREVIALTGPAEPVMDLKGDVVFRARPTYLGFEAVTGVKMRLGVLRDTVADDLVRTATHVVVFNQSLPPAARRFIENNYVPWGAVRVAGACLASLDDGSRDESFDLSIPGRYVVVDIHGPIHAMIDGVSASGGVELQPGRHTVTVIGDVVRPMVVWAGALRWPAAVNCSRCDAGHAAPLLLGR